MASAIDAGERAEVGDRPAPRLAASARATPVDDLGRRRPRPRSERAGLVGERRRPSPRRRSPATPRLARAGRRRSAGRRVGVGEHVEHADLGVRRAAGAPGNGWRPRSGRRVTSRQGAPPGPAARARAGMRRAALLNSAGDSAGVRPAMASERAAAVGRQASEQRRQRGQPGQRVGRHTARPEAPRAAEPEGEVPDALRRGGDGGGLTGGARRRSGPARRWRSTPRGRPPPRWRGSTRSSRRQPSGTTSSPGGGHCHGSPSTGPGCHGTS